MLGCERTQVSTIVLAGTLAGHALVTWLAVGAGKWIGG